MERRRITPVSEQLSNSAIKYEALNTIEFLKDQIKEIHQAKEIVWIQTMAFEPGHFSDLLVHTLLNASKRGVDVRFICDAYSDYVAANSFNHLKWLLSHENRQYQDFILQRKDALLKELGDQFAVNKTNIPNSLLSLTPFPGFLGRDHKKISIIDDVMYLGGSNLTPLDAKRADVMVKTNNASIIEGAKRIFLKSFSNDQAIDEIIVCDSSNQLMIDSGKPGRSLIMEQACQLVDTATQNITLVSPYVPMGKLRNFLNRAVLRGVAVEIVTSDESQLGFAPKLSQLVHNLGQSAPDFSITRCPDTVHAKILMVDGKYAIVGSHNFDELLVYFGTEEITLLTEEHSLINELTNYINRLKQGHLLNSI